MILRNFGSNAKTCLTATALLLVLSMIASPTIAQDTPQVDTGENAEQVETPESNTSTHEERYGDWDGGTSIINTGSDGMYFALDGGSVKKFEKSLAKAQEEMTPEEFITVQNALDYLLIYDLSARRDKKTLYKNLDGKTSAEIVAMVKWRLEGRPNKARFGGQ